MKRALAAAFALSLPVACLAQDEPAHGSALDALLSRVARYLNSEPVRRAPRAVAVVAVRGGAPLDQGEDLDLRLLDRAHGLRQAALSGFEKAEDLEQLRRVYGALAVSYWVQALAAGPSVQTAGQARAALSRFAARSDVPASLAALLSHPRESLDEKKLVAAGWGAYCRGITPAWTAPGGGGRQASFDEQTVQLEETLGSLRDSWTTKKLEGADKAEAFFLAGQTATALSRAPFHVRLVAASSAPAGADAKVQVSVVTGAPKAAAASQPEAAFSPRAIYEKASRAVVVILCASSDGGGEIGSGSLIDARGRVLTNAHVVIRKATKAPWPSIRVYFKPAKMTGDPAQDLVKPAAAKVLAYDSALDLALLDVGAPPEGTPTLSFGDPSAVSVGDRVAAIGHPEQGGLWTLTTGIVSTVVADLGGVKGRAAFQTDASINRGNSGGPLLDAAGDIVGVNTLMSRKAADGLAITAVNFAIRSDVARAWLPGGTQTVAAAAPPPASAPAKPAPARPAQKPVVVTESKPFSADELIQRQIKEMEDLGNEMEREIESRAH